MRRGRRKLGQARAEIQCGSSLLHCPEAGSNHHFRLHRTLAFPGTTNGGAASGWSLCGYGDVRTNEPFRAPPGGA